MTESFKIAHLFFWNMLARQYSLPTSQDGLKYLIQFLAPITLAVRSLCGYDGLYLITPYMKVLDDIWLLCVSETLLIQMYFLKTKYVVVS